MTVLVAHETVPIPASHLDLLTRPICGVLTTTGANGQPQSSLVWVDVDGGCARINTTLERQKGRNMLANPKVSLLVVDPDDTGRFIQIRGDAELVTDGALDHLDARPAVHPPPRY
jgi:PPOX class probable F420-dependent enzyme